MAEIASETAVDEEAQAPLGRRLLAEFAGTLIFVGVGTGAATAALMGPAKAIAGLTEANPQAGADPLVQALFQNSFADVLAVALTFGTVLAALVYAFGGVSGAHFNPMVTFALAVSRRFRWSEVPMYWLVQCAGAVAGAFVIAGIYGQDGASLGGKDILFGATVLGVDTFQALLAEAFIAFVLMTAIMAVAVDHRAPKGWSGLIIGLGLVAGILVTARATGGSANFARSLGPFVASLRYETGAIPWSDLGIYFLGPIIGGAAAALVYEGVTGLEQVGPAPQPGAATGGGDDDVEEALVHEHQEHHHAGPSDAPMGVEATAQTSLGEDPGDLRGTEPPRH